MRKVVDIRFKKCTSTVTVAISVTHEKSPVKIKNKKSMLISAFNYIILYHKKNICQEILLKKKKEQRFGKSYLRIA